MKQSISILGLLCVAGAAMFAAPAVAAAQAAGNHQWICSTYGYGGGRNTWRTVSGNTMPTRQAAEQDAERTCRHAAHLQGCQRSGCWAR
ncbi:MAG: hypothetical protein ACK5JT_07905 [Hyphomicrobiaceae bacterium]